MIDINDVKTAELKMLDKDSPEESDHYIALAEIERENVVNDN